MLKSGHLLKKKKKVVAFCYAFDIPISVRTLKSLMDQPTKFKSTKESVKNLELTLEVEKKRTNN